MDGGGVCILLSQDYFQISVTQQAGFRLRSNHKIHPSSYSIVSSAEQLLGQQLPPSGLLKIIHFYEILWEKRGSTSSFVQPSDSYSYCHF